MSADSMLASPRSTSSAPPRARFDLSTPQPIVALPCGSRSRSRTVRLVAASEAARLTAVVVLPTPPFWFAMAITRFMSRQFTALSRRGFESLALCDEPGVCELDARACELVGNRVGGTILAARTLEYFGEAGGNSCNRSMDLC